MSDYQDIMGLIREGKMIDAIKLHRQMNKQGLKESYDACCKMRDELSVNPGVMVNKIETYGFDGTIHGTKNLNVEVDKDGKVVSVWFRCCALPFDVTVVDYDRAAEMEGMSKRVNETLQLHAVSILNVEGR